VNVYDGVEGSLYLSEISECLWWGWREPIPLRNKRMFMMGLKGAYTSQK
jgi:hypothetical protein